MSTPPEGPQPRPGVGAPAPSTKAHPRAARPNPVAATQPVAMKLYRSVGFEPFGFEAAALKVGEEFVDEHWMVLRL